MPNISFKQRYQCRVCGNYLDIYSNNLAEITDFYCNRCHSKDQWEEVPRWYGQNVPGYLVVVEIEVLGKKVAFIPGFYLDNCIWFAGLKNKQLSMGEAMQKFSMSVRKAEFDFISVVDNERWFEKFVPEYKYNLHRIIEWRG